jgi:hypothetical protein
MVPALIRSATRIAEPCRRAKKPGNAISREKGMFHSLLLRLLLLRIHQIPLLPL